MPQKNKEILCLDELLNIEVFRLDYKFAISDKSHLVAFEVGRPISSSKLGTNQFGSQHEELDIYIANLSEDTTHCHKLIKNKAINLTGKQESFCPVWNPSGNYLAFVIVELSETSEYSLCVWCSKTNSILKLSKISPVNRYNAHKTFFWKNDSQILYTNQLNEDISFDLLINPAKSAYMDSKNTRHNFSSTEKVFDENKAIVKTDDYLLSCTSISEAFNEETLKSSVIHSGHTPLDGIGTLFSEKCRCYVIPLETDRLNTKLGAGYTSKFKIVNSELLSDSTEINCYPYQICFEKILPCVNTSNVWVKLINQESSMCWLGRIDLKEKKLVCYTDNVFYFNKLQINLYELIQSDKHVFFTVDDKDTDKILWIRFNKHTETHENLSYLLSDSKRTPLFYCGQGIFINEDEGVLTIYDWESNNPSKKIININSEEDAHYSVVWPRPQRINSILINHNSKKNFCMIRQNNGESLKYYITENGTDFTSIKMPQEHQIMGMTKLQDKFNVLALVTHEDGNDLVLVSKEHTRTLAKFNIHMKGINKAKKAYFSCNHSKEKVFCEVMLSDKTDVVVESPTILFFYPGLQYHASSHSYLHNYSLPPIFNHHIFTANGINCLFVGLPVTKTNIVKEGIFENFAEILASGIEKAHKLGYINKNNLFIQGQSWGAFVAMGVLSIMDTFRGCIASSGCYNPIAEYGVFDPNTEHSYSNIPSSCYLTRNTLVTNVHPWEDINYYMKSSPFIRAKDINTPVLLLHGEQDYVVRSFQSEQMYTALSLLGKPVKLIKYGGEGHIISSEKNIRHAWSSMLDFINNHQIDAEL